MEPTTMKFQRGMTYADEFINGLASSHEELMKKKGIYFELYTSADTGKQGETRMEDR